MIYNALGGAVFPAKLPKFIRLLWGPVSITIYTTTVHYRYKKFQSSRLTFEDNDHIAAIMIL